MKSRKEARIISKNQLPKWSYEADVVVLGFGFAGQVTAITARNLGADVLILEKMDEQRAGGNSRVSGQYVFTPTNIRDAVLYLTSMNHGFPVPQDMIQQWAEYMVENYSWFERMGGDETILDMPVTIISPEFPEMPGSNCVQVWSAKKPAGLWEFLKGKVIQSGIKIIFDTPGQELVQDAVTKRILGVAAEERGRKIYVKAKRAVVLCTGGFENNAEMVADYLHLYDTCTRGSPYNTGDGINMAQAVGADLWHMANPLVYLGFKAPDYDFGFKLSMTLGSSFIYIGADNKRFINEKWPGTHHGKHKWHGFWFPLFFPLPIHAIFDERMRLAGPINVDREPYAPWGWDYQIGGYVWSDDNSVELEKGWILKADSIGELAKKMNRDPVEVEDTVRKYNEACAAGVDLELERGAGSKSNGVDVTGRVEARLEPIEKPPFYAIEAKPQILNTQGGPRRNKYAQVLDINGEPIPGLYSSGELGSIYCDCYQGGGNVGECIAFGRIAGKGAAEEKPWKLKKEEIPWKE